MDYLKEKFLKDEFLTMTRSGALGRSKTYEKSAPERDRKRLRDSLDMKLVEIARGYTSIVTDDEHVSNISKIADDLTLEFSSCLRNGRFRIGVAQKALNLYLKYLWCMGLIPTPPHCPFDSRIISKLPERKHLKWTWIDSSDDYMRLVRAARRKAQGKSLSEWELEAWGNLRSVGKSGVEEDGTMRDTDVNQSSGWQALATKFHDELASAMMPYKRRVLATSVIKDIIGHVPALAEKKEWVYPSDHCSNHMNRGACECAGTEKAIFERIRRGVYRVL